MGRPRHFAPSPPTEPRSPKISRGNDGNEGCAPPSAAASPSSSSAADYVYKGGKGLCVSARSSFVQRLVSDVDGRTDGQKAGKLRYTHTHGPLACNNSMPDRQQGLLRVLPNWVSALRSLECVGDMEGVVALDVCPREGGRRRRRSCCCCWQQHNGFSGDSYCSRSYMVWSRGGEGGVNG